MIKLTERTELMQRGSRRPSRPRSAHSGPVCSASRPVNSTVVAARLVPTAVLESVSAEQLVEGDVVPFWPNGR